MNLVLFFNSKCQENAKRFKETLKHIRVGEPISITLVSDARDANTLEYADILGELKMKLTPITTFQMEAGNQKDVSFSENLFHITTHYAKELFNSSKESEGLLFLSPSEVPSKEGFVKDVEKELRVSQSLAFKVGESLVVSSSFYKGPRSTTALRTKPFVEHYASALKSNRQDIDVDSITSLKELNSKALADLIPENDTPVVKKKAAKKSSRSKK